MDSNQENKKRTIRLRLTNDHEFDINFASEPQGMGFFIPPKSTIELIISQEEENDFEIVFNGPNEFTLWTNYVFEVLQDGAEIYAQSIEEIFAGFKRVGQEVSSSLAKAGSKTNIKLTHEQRRILIDYMTVLRNLGLDKFKERANEFNLLDEEIAVLDALMKQKAYILKPSDPTN